MFFINRATLFILNHRLTNHYSILLPNIHCLESITNETLISSKVIYIGGVGRETKITLRFFIYFETAKHICTFHKGAINHEASKTVLIRWLKLIWISVLWIKSNSKRPHYLFYLIVEVLYLSLYTHCSVRIFVHVCVKIIRRKLQFTHVNNVELNPTRYKKQVKNRFTFYFYKILTFEATSFTGYRLLVKTCAWFKCAVLRVVHFNTKQYIAICYGNNTKTKHILYCFKMLNSIAFCVSDSLL